MDTTEEKRKRQRDYMKIWCAENPDKVKANKKRTYQNNKEKDIARSKSWREKNKEYKSLKDKEYQAKNKEKISENKRRYYLSKQKELISKNTLYTRNRRKTDPLYKTIGTLRCRTRIIFTEKGLKKRSKTSVMLGVSFDKVKEHLEKQFKEGMTWENHGRYGWHIDHIIPLSFAKNEEELINLCHYTNLQPLWAIDNIRKGNKITVN